VTFWMHNEFLDFGGEKMSKSKGNVKALSDLVERGIDPLAFRYFFLQAHYRQQQTFNDEAMEAAATGYRRLCGVVAELRESLGESPGELPSEPSEAGDADAQAPYRERFRAALADDLNAPKAMAVVWDVARSDDLAAADRLALLLAFDAVLGLDLANAKKAAVESDSDPRIDGLLAERQAARAAKDFAEADRIRDALQAEGIEIVDTPEGARWRRS